MEHVHGACIAARRKTSQLLYNQPAVLPVLMTKSLSLEHSSADPSTCKYSPGQKPWQRPFEGKALSAAVIPSVIPSTAHSPEAYAV